MFLSLAFPRVLITTNKKRVAVKKNNMIRSKQYNKGTEWPRYCINKCVKVGRASGFKISVDMAIAANLWGVMPIIIKAISGRMTWPDLCCGRVARKKAYRKGLRRQRRHSENAAVINKSWATLNGNASGGGNEKWFLLKSMRLERLNFVKMHRRLSKRRTHPHLHVSTSKTWWMAEPFTKRGNKNVSGKLRKNINCISLFTSSPNLHNNNGYCLWWISQHNF